MKLYIILDYKERFPGSSGKELTDRILSEILKSEGVVDPVICRTEKGKPYEKEHRRHFSLSHTGDVFGCVTADHEVGLDIQRQRSADFKSIAERFFTEEEAEAVLDDVGIEFYTVWTRKESLIKLRGSSLADILGTESVIDRSDVSFIDLELEDDITGCICVPAGLEEGYEISFSYGKQDQP